MQQTQLAKKFKKLRVIDIKPILRSLNLSTIGKKVLLIERLTKYIMQNKQQKTKLNSWEIKWSDDYYNPHYQIIQSFQQKIKNSKNPIQRIAFKKQLMNYYQLTGVNLIKNLNQLWIGLQRTKKIKQVKPNFCPHEGDIVVNSAEAGYRNQGVYIVYTGGGTGPPAVLSLQDYPDDYGSIPFWLTPGYDFGYEYFSRYLVDHNSYMPINFKQLQLISQEVPELVSGGIIECLYFYRSITVVSIFKRITDGVLLKFVSHVLVSDPSQNGPIKDFKITSVGSCGSKSYSNVIFKSGETLRMEYKLDANYNKVIDIKPWTIPQSLSQRILDRVNEFIPTDSIKYVELTNPNEAYFELSCWNQGYQPVIIV